MKKIIFKTISIGLIFTHLFTICFRDVSFAAESPKSQKLFSKVSKEELIGYDKKSAPIITGQETQKTRSRALNAGGGDSFSPEKAIKSFYLDPFSGALSLSLPIFTPPGRKGVQPDLNLTYSSRNANGPFGWGWRMDFGYIERSTKDGLPKYDDTDTFICSLYGKNYELVPIGNNEYRAKNESDFLKFIFSNGYWTIKNKKGNVFYFGRSKEALAYKNISSRDTNPSNIFRWYLDGIKDLTGNSLFASDFYMNCVEPLPYKIYYNSYNPNSDDYDLTANTGFIEIKFRPLEGQRVQPGKILL